MEIDKSSNEGKPTDGEEDCSQRDYELGILEAAGNVDLNDGKEVAGQCVSSMPKDDVSSTADSLNGAEADKDHGYFNLVKSKVINYN